MMKRHLFFGIVMVLITLATAMAQAPMSFTYQAVVRDREGDLVSNSKVGVRISIMQSSTNTVVYNNEYSTRTNANGLFSIVIGDSVNSIDVINWTAGPYILKCKVDPNGGGDYTILSSQQMFSVPYALHANTVDGMIRNTKVEERQVLSISNDTVFLTGGSYVVLPKGFSGDYDSLTNKPVIPTIPTNVSAFINDVGYLTSYTETQALSISNDTVFLTGGSFVKLPAGFSGNYNDLTNKPVLFSGNYNDLTNKPVIPIVPVNVSAFTNDAGYLTSYTETQVLSISNDTIYLTGGSFVKIPAGFSGDYNDLTNKPALFSGNYNDLTNKPVIPTIPTNVSAFANDAGYLTSYTETQTLSNVAANNDSVNSQIKDLYDPTDSMDAVNLRTLHAVIRRYDSIVNNLLKVIDTLRNPGALPGIFSVSATQQVRFSQGNLQYSASGIHATADGIATGTWRFAEHQWDTIGTANSNISSSYIGWIDLFGWGTSGYNNKYPYMTSTTPSDYGYGNNHIAGTNYDWGVYNAISNGGNASGQWRTLTYTEWNYILNTRTTASGIRYVKATVNGVAGLIIVPDNWSSSTYTLNSTNTSSAAFTANVISLANWGTLEKAGCVFLPAAGNRNGTSVSEVGSGGQYWSAHYSAGGYAYVLRIDNVMTPALDGYYHFGRSVRLVKDK